MIRFPAKGMVIVLVVLSAVGCVRPGGKKPSPVNVATATRQAWARYSNNLADSFEELAKTPPKTVTEAAEYTVKADEASRKQFRQEMAKVMQPSLPVIKDAKGKDTDELDPLAARRLFGEIAKGLRK